MAAVVVLVARQAGPGGDGGDGGVEPRPGSVLVRFNHLVYTLGTPESMARAERLLRGVLQTHPRKDQIYAKLGNLEIHRATRQSNIIGPMRPSARAKEMFRKALGVNPRNLDALQGLATYYEFRDQPRAAMALDDRIIAAHPRNIDARTHKGRCLLNLRQYVRAEEVLKEALRMARKAHDTKGEVVARDLLGTAYTRQGKYALAEEVLVKAVQQAEANKIVACPYAALGELYHLTGRRDKVAKLRKRAADMESHKPKMQYFAAKTFHEQGDPDQALVYIRRAIALHDDARFRALEKVILADLKPRPPKEELQAALAAFSQDNFHKANKHIDRALASSSLGQYKVVKGFIQLLEKKYTAAEKLFSEARTADSADTGAATGLGHIKIIRKKYRAARALLEPAIKAGEAKLEGARGSARAAGGYQWMTYRMACLGMGWVRANTNKHAAALAYFDRVLAHDPKDTFALLGKGNSFNALGKLAAAEKHLQQVLDLDPVNRFAMAELALVKYNRGQDAESERLFKAALRVAPRKYTCPHEGLGLLYMRAGKLDQAKESFRRAIKINPDIEFKEFNGLARIFIREGKYQRARVLLRKSIQNYPHDDEARKLLASIRSK